MDDETQSSRWLSFDPTIHAGHIITAVTVAFCAVGSWYSLQGDISSLKSSDAAQTKRIDYVEEKNETNRRETDQKIEALVKDSNQALIKLRDDMNGWFMALDQKLDRKADKR